MRSPQSRAVTRSHRTRRARTGATLVALGLTAALAASLATPAAADSSAAAVVQKKKKKKVTGYYEMPFPCGQEWKGTTRGDHSPSSRAIDWNRPDDDGDEVVASAPGTVTTANKTGKTGYGRYVVITHLNGESTLYGHLSSVAVAAGQAVDQGVVIGNVGSTGNSTGPHLHFEERSGTTVAPAVFSGVGFVYGSTQVSRNCVDVPLAANMVGSAVSELVIFSRNQKATFQIYQLGAAPTVIAFGRTTDDPLVGDWDGDGTANVAVRRPAESTFYLSTPAGTGSYLLGIPSDRPIAGDWNADGLTDIGVRRASNATFYLRAGDGSLTTIALGDANDVPVTGDWNGDRRADVGVYDSATATFTLRYTAANGVPWIAAVPFGNPGDLPVVGDWDGNGITDLGVWRPSTGTFLNRRAPNARMAARSVVGVQFGRPRG